MEKDELKNKVITQSEIERAFGTDLEEMKVLLLKCMGCGHGDILAKFLKPKKYVPQGTGPKYDYYTSQYTKTTAHTHVTLTYSNGAKTMEFNKEDYFNCPKCDSSAVCILESEIPKVIARLI